MTPAQRTDKYKQKHVAQELCRNCPRRARAGASLCVKCRAVAQRTRKLYLPKRREIRDYRKNLGFCVHCKAKAEPGYIMCARHIRLNKAACDRYRGKLIKQRGWKMIRVKM